MFLSESVGRGERKMKGENREWGNVEGVTEENESRKEGAKEREREKMKERERRDRERES